MNPLNKFLKRGFATCECGWETPLTRSLVIEGYYFRIARLLYLVHLATKHHKIKEEQKYYEVNCVCCDGKHWG